MAGEIVIGEPTERDGEAIREVKFLAMVPLRELYRPSRSALARKVRRTAIRREPLYEQNGKVVPSVEFEDRDT